jgi:hypothetical protein
MATSFLRPLTRNLVAGQSAFVGSYKVPSGKAGAIKGLSVAARNGLEANFTAELCDTVGTVLSAYIERTDIAAGDTFVVIGAEQTQFIVTGDQVKITCHAGSVDAIMSLAEIG